MRPLEFASGPGPEGRDGGRLWWRQRVCVVTDDASLGQPLGEQVGKAGGVPEPVAWREAPALEPPLAGLIAHVDEGAELPEVLRALEAWAARAWQPCAVVSVASSRGAARVDAHLETLRYPHRRSSWGVPPTAWTVHALRGVLERRAWLASWYAREVGDPAPEIVEAIAAGALGEAPATSVKAWARRLGLVTWELDRLLHARGLPPPRETLPRLRIWRAVVEAADSPNAHGPTRDHLAAAVGYASGRYLGRRAKALTGRSFWQLAQGDLRVAVRLLART